RHRLAACHHRRDPQGDGRGPGRVRPPLLPEARAGGDAAGDRPADDAVRPGRPRWRLRGALARRHARLLRRSGGAVSVTKVIEVIGSSATSSDDAVREAVAAAAKSIRGISNVDVVSVTCDVEQGVITRWNALVKISFPVEPR